MDGSRRPISRPQDNPENIRKPAALHAEAHLIAAKPQSVDLMAIALSIVSNSRLLSDGLLLLLAPHLNLRLIGTYSSEYRFSAQLPNPPDHVILLDSGVGDAAALAWTRYWHGLVPAAYILVLELTNNVELILACIQAGAGGYLLQGASTAEVVEAIEDAHGGVARCSPEIIAQLFARLAASNAPVPPAVPPPLTAREVEVLRWIARGYTNLEIAAQLVIELRTVKQHVHHILSKTHLRTRWEVAQLAAEQGWLDPNRATALTQE
jgi:DNA-binding NarL/FixJ family response regulator